MRFGPRVISNSDFAIRNIDRILTTGRCQKHGQKSDSTQHVVLVEAADFRRWLTGKKDKYRKLEDEDLSRIVNTLDRHSKKHNLQFRKLDLMPLREVLRKHGALVSRDRFVSEVWYKLQKSQDKGSGPTNPEFIERVRISRSEMEASVLKSLGLLGVGRIDSEDDDISG